MNVETIVCKEMVHFMMNKYPHLNEADVHQIFNYAILTIDTEYNEKRENGYLFPFGDQKVIIPKFISERYSIHDEFPFITGSDNIIWSRKIKKDGK